MARSKPIAFTREAVHDREESRTDFIEKDDNETEEIRSADKLQVPVVPIKHHSWRESLVLPLDVILPSPSSPEELKAWPGAYSNMGYSSSCIHCPCQGRRRRRSSGDSEASSRSKQSVERPRQPLQVRYQTQDGDDQQPRVQFEVETSYKEVERLGAVPHHYPSRPSDLRLTRVVESEEQEVPCCFSCSKKKAYDDVDGPSGVGGRRWEEKDAKRRKSSLPGPILDAFIRLIFFKILFVDIGISLGDLVTDFVQGFNLIFEGIDSVSFPYGISLIASCWIPCFAAPLHLGIVAYMDIFKKRGFLEALVLILLYIGLFPLIPTICYICLLLTPRSSRDQRRRYREVERKAHEIKSITASVEAPIQLTLILYLMLRGIIPLPWNEPMSSSCITDKLGRVACLPSIPMLSIIFSVLSILKCMFDLNIHPLLANKECGLDLLNESFLLFLRYLPFSAANIIFRILSFAFLLVYLDYWTAIPAVILFLLNLVVFAFSFTRLTRSRAPSSRGRTTPDAELRFSDFGERSNTVSTVLDSTVTGSGGARSTGGWRQDIRVDIPKTPEPTEVDWRPDFRRKQEMGWNPEVMSKPVRTFSTSDYVKRKDTVEDCKDEPPPKAFMRRVEESALKNIYVQSEVTPTAENADKEEERVDMRPKMNPIQRYLSRLSSVRTDTDLLPSVINEGNTSIFFNAMSGLFFPSCHSHIKPFRSSSAPLSSLPDQQISLDQLVTWQNLILSRQVYLINSLLCLVIVLVWGLVSFSSFNYNSNVLDPFWFNVTFAILVSLWLVTLILAGELRRPLQQLLSNWFPSVCGDHSEEETEGTPDFAKEMLDGNRTVLALERKEKPSVTKRICLSFVLSLLLVVPPLIALTGYRYGNSSQPYIFLIKDSTDMVDLGIIAAFPLHDPLNHKHIVGNIETSCTVDLFSDYSGKILVFNTSKPLCRIFIEKDDFYNSTSNTGAAGLVILDSTPKENWRVSSPYDSQYNRNYGNLEIPVLMVREADWVKYNEFLGTQDSKISIVYEESMVNLETLFSCSSRPQLSLGGYIDEGSCTGGKSLSSNGSILENICVKGKCSQYGHRCVSSFFSRFEDLTLTLECESRDLDGINLEFKFDGEKLVHSSNLALPSSNRGKESYCCRGQDHNNTFLEVYQGQTCFTSWREVEERARVCQWSEWTRSTCTAIGVNVMRFCLVQSSCVIKEYYSTKGCSEERVDHCQTNPNKCT